MHKKYANQSLQNNATSYKFNFPKNFENGKFVDDGLVGQIFGSKQIPIEEELEDFTGMNPQCKRINNLSDKETEFPFLEFDSSFESGNLDYVVKTYP